MDIPAKHYFTPDEVAKLLSVSRHRVYRMVKEKRLKAMHFGSRTIRIPAEEVDRLMRPEP